MVVLPEQIQSAGLIILRVGPPSGLQMTLSPRRLHDRHRAELKVVIHFQIGRASAFDDLIVASGDFVCSKMLQKAQTTANVKSPWSNPSVPTVR